MTHSDPTLIDCTTSLMGMCPHMIIDYIPTMGVCVPLSVFPEMHSWLTEEREV